MSAKMYINLEHIKYNIKEIRKKINSDVTLFAMIKADAYGLGDIGIANFLEKLEINHFGVAIVDEAVHLKENAAEGYILVTSQFLKEDIPNILKYNLITSISDLDLLGLLNLEALKLKKKVKIHIKVDTGMKRLGFNPNETLYVVNYIKKNFSNVIIDGIYTHLSSADTDNDFTTEQLTIFDNALNILKENGHNFKYVHALNSSGLLKFPNYSYNSVRIGDLLYGYYPNKSLKELISLKPSVKLTAPIIHIKNIPPNSHISYSGTYKSIDEMKIATLQIGYADGLDRKLSNNLNVFINGFPCKIVGSICMDMCMIDITNIDNIKIGDYATILDYDDSIYTLADIIGTINYEVISRISKRVKRIYIEK